MNSSNECLQSLCKKAATEQDSQKFLELVREINRLIDEKFNRLSRATHQNKVAFGLALKPVLNMLVKGAPVAIRF